MQKKTKIAIAVAIVIVAIVGAIFLIPSKFEKVKSESLKIAGQMKSGDGYFTLDTYPYENATVKIDSYTLERTAKQAIEAIKYANEGLGFSGSVYSDMLNTTALMGRQSEENSKYKVSWTYHPDRGLEVTYSVKK